MLPRFYDIDEGELLIDGNSIRDLKIKDLKKFNGHCYTRIHFIQRYRFNNIAFGMSNVKKQTLIAAAKIANAHEFIDQMPNKYQTNIGDRGSNFQAVSVSV